MILNLVKTDERKINNLQGESNIISLMIHFLIQILFSLNWRIISDSTIEMVGDAQNHSLMNVRNDVNPSRNLFRQKDAHPLSVLCSGKWLQTVRSSPKVSSCELSSSPSHLSSKVGENYETESEKIHKKVIPLSSKTSFSSNYTDGSLQFTMRANGTPHFVFKLENQKDVYVASYVEDQSVYMIYLQRGESSSSPHLVGRIKVSTLSLDRVIEREFVLFSSNVQIPSNGTNRGLTKKVVKKTRGTSRLSRTSFIPDLCSWDQPFKEEPSFDVEQVNLLENNLPTNLETLAVVVKQETVREEIGGWGLNFLKKSQPMVQSNDATETETSTTSVTCMDVVIPSGIHGGPEDGPLSLIQRWKSQGNCDCGGWDLGCSFTHLNGQPRKDQFELLIEGSKHETIGLKIVNVHEGLYIVQFEANLSILQSFSIALAFIHCQNHQPKHL